MNVLIYENDVKPQCGGVQRVSVNLAGLLKKHGHRVFVAHRSSVSEDEVPECFDGHLRVNTDCQDDALRLAEYAERLEVGLIVHQQPEILEKRRSFWLALRQNCQAKFIGYLQTTPEFYRIGFQHKDWSMPSRSLHALVQQCSHFFYPKDRYILRSACDIPDRLFLLSESFVKVWERLAGRPADRGNIQICPNFLPDPSRAEQDFSFENKEKLVIFVGRMEEYPKNVSMILRMWKILSVRFPDWTLGLIGGGPQLPKYQKMAAELPRVFFTGQTDPAPYYRRASLMFLTSLWEGMPMVMLEGMDYGVVPVVHKAVESLSDVLPENGSGGGVLVPYMDSEAFILKASQLMGNPGRRRELGELARKNIEENFSEKAAWGRWEHILAGESLT